MFYDYIEIECESPSLEKVDQIKQWFTHRLPIAYADGFYHVPYSLRDCKEMLAKELEQQVTLDAISNLATEYDGEIMLECLRHFAREEFKEIVPGVFAMSICEY